MVYDCIAEKLSDLKTSTRSARTGDLAEVNDLKLKIKSIEQAEQRLLNTMLAGGLNEDLLTLANQKATQLKREKLTLQERLEKLKNRKDKAGTIVNLTMVWQKADYNRKKEVAMIMIYKIMIAEDGGIKVFWNI